MVKALLQVPVTPLAEACLLRVEVSPTFFVCQELVLDVLPFMLLTALRS